MKYKKILMYIFRIIIFSIISLVLGLTIYTINARNVNGQKLVMPFNKTIAFVLTGSMEPTIGVNDLIVVEKTRSYEVNDIVVYQSNNSLIVHRIISIDGEIVRTAGDNNNGALDEPININAIQGEVIKIYPFFGLVLKIMRTPIAILLILSLAIIFFILSYKKEDQENKDKVQTLKEEVDRLKKELNK